jgi:hypothetical protein
MKGMLCCPECHVLFIHSDVERELLRFEAYTSLTKPQFPDGGLRVLRRMASTLSSFNGINLFIRILDAVRGSYSLAANRHCVRN